MVVAALVVEALEDIGLAAVAYEVVPVDNRKRV